jgi:hypothetical protein
VSCNAEVCCKIVHKKGCKTKGRKSQSSKKKEKEFNTITSPKKKSRGKMPVCLDKNEFDMATNKYLLMLVHAPMQFQPEEIVSSVELGFHEFEQRFEVVYALSFSPLSSLPNQSD